MKAAVKPLYPLIALALLGGCIKFGSPPPPELLSLDSASQVPVGTTQASNSQNSISVKVPVVPQELAVQRVPVRATDTSVAYIKDAQWVEPPAHLFARLLSDTIAARTGRVVLGNSQAYVEPGALLSGELRDFGVDAATQEAVVTYDASLIRNGTQTVEKRRFQARVPVASITPLPVSRAINQAANQVADEVAAWVGK